MNTARLEKLIRLTYSDNDHEALNALRRAQQIAGDNLWEVISKKDLLSDHMDLEVLEILKIDQKILVKNLKLLQNELKNAYSQDYKTAYQKSVTAWAREFFQYNEDSWMSSRTLKEIYDDAHQHHKENSLNLFSRNLANTFQIKSVKGGTRNQIMGFTLQWKTLN